MAGWQEIRIWYAGPPHVPDLFEYKRRTLLQVLRAHGIEHFLILAEPHFILLRISVEDQVLTTIREELERTLAPLFDRITIDQWSPIDDARGRILAAKRRLPGNPLPEDDSGWEVRGRDDSGQWIVGAADLDAEIEAFARFMTRIVGQFTRAYLSEMPSTVENRWLMSVLVHLMLNSISVGQREEQEIREFPYL